MRRGATRGAPTRPGALEEILWCLVLLAYIALFVILLWSRRLYELVHPRMAPFVITGIIILLALAIFQGAGVLAGRRTAARRPVLAMFLLPFAAVPLFTKSTSSLMAGEESIQLGSVVLSSAASTSAVAGAFAPPAPVATTPLKPPGAGPIVLDEGNYLPTYEAISTSPESYVGRTVEVSGFVYKGPSLGGEERFLTARELMWCCAVDATTIGFVSEFPGGTVPPPSTWVVVKGTLGITSLKDLKTGKLAQVPLLTVDQLQEMETPDFEFVYPTAVLNGATGK